MDLIKVTEGTPLFSAEESAQVIESAEEEGVDKNEYKSGKYKLGGEILLDNLIYCVCMSELNLLHLLLSRRLAH